jgi:hypothetical protein
LIHGSGVSGRVITYSRLESSKCPKLVEIPPSGVGGA